MRLLLALIVVMAAGVVAGIFTGKAVASTVRQSENSVAQPAETLAFFGAGQMGLVESRLHLTLKLHVLRPVSPISPSTPASLPRSLVSEPPQLS